MCGINGLLSKQSAIDVKAILLNMNQSIRHRGPDDNGMQIFTPDHFQLGFGHVRLSIIDLSAAGHQPMSTHDQTLWITFNGEIYNYQSVKNELLSLGVKFISGSDTEVVLYAYKQWGMQAVDKLNGMFAFAIWDTIKSELVIVRDRLGIKPLYYYSDDKNFIFSSEIKAILATNLCPKRPDYFALSNPTRFFQAPYTGFENIKKLSPGHFIKLTNGQFEIHQYWKIKPQELKLSENEAIELLDTKLNEAVKLQMVADVKVGALLSGGLDSSIITALMTKYTNKPIHTFTIKFSDKDKKFEQMSDDSYYADLIAKKFGFVHHEIEISPNVVELLPKMIYHLDEPLADPAAINTYLISEEARKEGIIVLLNGMGGDEIFGGYRKQLACLKAETYQKIPSAFRNMIEASVNNLPVASQNRGFKLIRWIKRFLSFASLPQLERYLVSDLSMGKQLFNDVYSTGIQYEKTFYYNTIKQLLNEYPNVSFLTKLCYLDSLSFLPDHNLHYSDKATMAASVEGRPPLTDHNLVEFIFNLEPKFRINGNEQKWLLKKVSEKYLPKEIIYRPKAPFGSPLRSWVRNDLKDLLAHHLSETNIKKTGLYNYKGVQKIIQLDRDGKEDYAHLIWQMLTVQIWFEKNFYS